MKKITLFLLILLFSLGNLFAIDRNSNDAYQLAQEFFNKPTEKAGLKKAPSTKKSAQLVFSKAKKNKLSTNYYYIFNQNDNHGFVIVSGDKSTSEILGYSDEGGFDPQNIPDNLKYWLSVYEDEMDNLTVIDSQKTKVDTSKPSKVTSLSNQTLASVSPLLGDIKWGQGSPYNDQCPIIDSNTKRRAATGCVATGMAQVMKYHQWPITGTGSNSYITGTKQIPLSVDFSKTTFDWANITATYNDNSSVTQKNAVATLMYNCGVAAFMNYAESSGATPRNATRALINNFGYDSNTQYTERAYYTRDEWISMLKEELSAARPVLYDGDTETSGHFFVCDGYDNNNMFHFNWGWNGGLNGYFRISVLDPGDQGIGSSTGGYNKSQGIIIGLQKPTNTTTPISIIRARGTLTYSAPSLARDANIEVKVGSLINKGANDFSGKIGLALYDNNNNYISDLKVNSISGLGSNKGWGNYSFNGFKIGPEVINGYYRIFPVFKTNTGNNWEIIRTYVGTPNYINVNVTSDLIYFSTPTDESPVLQLNSLTKIGNFYSNRNGKINASITNNGKEYNSQIKIKLQSTTDNNIYQIVSSKSINITAGETRELIYNEPITLPAGNYHMSVLYNPNNIPGDDNATQLGNNTAVTILESTYKILIQVGANGTVKESNVTLANNSHLPVEMETTKTFIFTPSTNYGIATLTYNGMDVKSQLVANKYTIPAANANATLSVTFSKQFIHVATAGTLYDLLSADEKNEITNLTVSGTIDARDVKCMRDNMPKLVVLDLSAANIAAYAGNEGTDLNGDRTYLANEMPQRSFQFKTGLTQCKMPNSLTSIGFCAFEFCSGLTGTLAIPSLVNIIGDYAFGGCSSLIGVLTIPRLVTNIGKQGFKDCTGLSQITIARSAPPTIQSTTFDGINKTTCQLEVPPNSRSTYKAANYWKDFFTISESVLIFDISVQVGPNGTVKLNNSLLASNTVLAVEKRTTRTFVFTPAANYGIATIKYNNVDVKSQLAGNQYTTPESNGNATFSVTFGLTKLTINVPTAGTLSNLISADDKNALNNLTVTGTIDARDVKCMRNNMPELTVLDLSAATIVAYTGTGGTELNSFVSYPANEMPQRSFQFNTQLTQCKMPNSLISIGFCAFEGCSGLTGTLAIPNSVTIIGDYTFKACSGLTGVLTIPKLVTIIGKQGFKDCTGLSQIIVANSVPPTIQSTTFEGVNKNTCTLEVPRGTQSVYKEANYWKDFLNISQLTYDITIEVGPNGTVKENNFTLANNSLLIVNKGTTRTFSFTPAANYVILTLTYNDVDIMSQLSGANQYTTAVANVDATLSVTFGLTKLTINIPQAGTLCNLISFDDKNALTDLTLTGTIDARDVKCMRDNMPKLAVLDLSATTMAAYAGNEGTDLSGDRTYLANEMPQRSFQFKTGLTQCKMPNSLTSIGFCAFEGCSGLIGAFSIPNSVIRINDYAFKACSSLTAVTIPNSVTNIYKQGFKDCTGLSQITVARSLPPIIYDGTTFDGINKSTCQLEVPRGSMPAYKAANQWKDFLNISELTDLATDYFRSTTSGNWSTNTTWESSLDGVNWGTTSLIPSSLASSISIVNDHLVTVTADASASTLTVTPGAKLTLNSGKTLTANTFTLQSNASGTGTFVDNGGTFTATTTHVQQYLTAGRNWYISSPVSGAKSAVFGATSTYPMYYFVEPNSSNANTRWAQITNSAANLTPVTGYIANMDAAVLAGKSNVVTFTGTLNSGDITTGQNGVPSLTRTVGQERAGFNLIGNPYPSYMNWSDVNRTDVDPTLWYRTKVGSVYKYYTYLPGTGAREEDGISVPAGVTNLIPPMQAFWVRVSAGKTTGSVGFTNAMRAHRDNASNIFRAPAATKSARQLVRLQVSNGVNDDETVIYFNSNASTGFDTYDSPKMSNDNVAIPEIYTTTGAENLVINGMNAIPYDTELALGFKTGQSNSFTLQATEINNFDGVAKLILKDKKLNVEQELALNVPYEFSSDVVNSVNRFSLIFRSPSITTEAENLEGASSTLIYCNENNQIIVNYNNAIASNARVEVYNAVGQKLVSQRMTSAITVINKALLKGVYMVTVVNDAKSSTQKVIIK